MFELSFTFMKGLKVVHNDVFVSKKTFVSISTLSMNIPKQLGTFIIGA